jgi:alkylation response protein AidB-like acyl-CoA dehydrogenase
VRFRSGRSETGLVGVEIPEAYGGAGMGSLESVLVSEELSRVDAGVRAAIGTEFGSRMIAAYGSDAQKERFLRGITSGELIGAMANTEPAHGSDAASIETRAERVRADDGSEEYVIDGTKTFTTHGTIADYVLTMCRTGEPGHGGISAIIVETDRESFTVESEIDKMGWNASETAQLRYDGVRVPAENLVGEEDQGFYQLMDFFEQERVGIAAGALGIAQGCLDHAVEYAREREQFGQPIAEFQAIGHVLADMAVQVENARRLTYDAAARLDRGETPTKLASMAKLYTSEVQRNVIAEHVLDR